VHVELGGSHAGGAGNRLVLGDHVIGTGGVDGYDGCGGGAGVVGVVVVLELVPQATRANANRVGEHVASTADLLTATGTARIHDPPRISFAPHTNPGSERRTLESPLQAEAVKFCVGGALVAIGPEP